MTLTYRDGRPGDGAAVSNLFCRVFAATFGHMYASDDLASFLRDKAPEAFEAQLSDPNYAFRLVEEGGAVIGYIKMGPNELPGDAPDRTWELHHLYLDDAAKGRGIAEALIDWGFAEARERGFTHLQLSVFIENERARRVYEKRGFVEVGAYKFMVGNHEDDDRIMRVAL